MGYTKSFLLLGLLFAVVLLISSEVSARELAETAETQGVQTDGVEDAKYGGHGHGYGHGHGHGGYGHGHGGYGHGGHGHGKPGHGGHPGHGDADTEGDQS